jgi:hypothetical protein
MSTGADSKSVSKPEQPQGEPITDVLKRLETKYTEENQKLAELLAELASVKDRVLAQQQVVTQAQSNHFSLQNKYLVSIIQEQNKQLQQQPQQQQPPQQLPPRRNNLANIEEESTDNEVELKSTSV